MFSCNDFVLFAVKSVGVAECESHPCSGVLCGKGAECASQLRPRGLMGVCRFFFVHVYTVQSIKKKNLNFFEDFLVDESDEKCSFFVFSKKFCDLSD
jgi:hypothetical protein